MPSGEQEAAEPFSFSITPGQLEELTALAGELHAEAGRCRDAGRWSAALIFLGGSAEAVLRWALIEVIQHVPAGHWPRQRKEDILTRCGARL